MLQSAGLLVCNSQCFRHHIVIGMSCDRGTLFIFALTLCRPRLSPWHCTVRSSSINQSPWSCWAADRWCTCGLLSPPWWGWHWCNQNQSLWSAEAAPPETVDGCPCTCFLICFPRVRDISQDWFKRSSSTFYKKIFAKTLNEEKRKISYLQIFSGTCKWVSQLLTDDT